MNVELLEKVRKHILEEPKRINMKNWIINPFILRDKFQELKYQNKLPACDTVGCIAGWALQVSSKKKLTSFDKGDAQVKLNLTYEQANRLFLLENMATDKNYWPAYFENKLKNLNPGTRAYARVVSQRIKHFIATGGKE